MNKVTANLTHSVIIVIEVVATVFAVSRAQPTAVHGEEKSIFKDD
jgi:hypothetical protein